MSQRTRSSIRRRILSDESSDSEGSAGSEGPSLDRESSLPARMASLRASMHQGKTARPQ